MKKLSFTPDCKKVLTALSLAGGLALGPLRAQTLASETDSVTHRTRPVLHVRMNETSSSLRFHLELSKPVVYLFEPVMVTLLDQDLKQLLFKHTFAYYELRTIAFDLSHLEDGNYSLEILMGDEKVVKPFEIQTQVSRAAFARN